MTTMFQYKGKAYAFCFIDETLLDLEKAIIWIEEGKCIALPMSPEEVTQFLRAEKADPGKEKKPS